MTLNSFSVRADPTYGAVTTVGVRFTLVTVGGARSGAEEQVIAQRCLPLADRAMLEGPAPGRAAALDALLGDV